MFGSGVVAGRSGVVLQNRGAYFSLDPAHPNRVAPGKTPLHTLIASLALRDDTLWGVVGCMGADGQPQIHPQTYVAMIDHGLDIQQAVQAPRWLSGRFALGEARDTLHIEARFPAETIAELARRGHLIDRWGEWNELAGHAHGITIDPRNGVRQWRLGSAQRRRGDRLLTALLGPATAGRVARSSPRGQAYEATRRLGGHGDPRRARPGKRSGGGGAAPSPGRAVAHRRQR